MSTDKICKAIEKKAISELKEKYQSSGRAFKKSLGLSGTDKYFTFKVSGCKDMRIPLSQAIDQINTQRIEQVKERVCAEAISEFLTSVSAFKGHVEELEEYIESLD